MRKLAVLVALLAASLVACDDAPNDRTDATDVQADARLKVKEDYAKEAQERIRTTNLDAEVRKLEREITEPE